MLFWFSDRKLYLLLTSKCNEVIKASKTSIELRLYMYILLALSALISFDCLIPKLLNGKPLIVMRQKSIYLRIFSVHIRRTLCHLNEIRLL